MIVTSLLSLLFSVAGVVHAQQSEMFGPFELHYSVVNTTFLEPEVAAAYMEKHGLSGEPHESPEVQAEIQSVFDSVNEHLARVEQIKKFTILDRPLTIEGGELTPTLKVKRRVVRERLQSVIDGLYAEEAADVTAN